MRRRIVLLALAVAVGAAALFGLPVVVVGERFLDHEARERVELEAQRVARAVDVAEARDPRAGDVLQASQLGPVASGLRHVVVTLPGGRQLTLGPEVTDPDALRETAMTRGGATVEVVETSAHLAADTFRLRLVGLAMGVGAAAVAFGFAYPQSRRLSEPLAELAQAAEQIGSGDPRPHGRRYGVPELDRVAQTLDASADRIAGLLATERRFAADASHQLRTPLTALSMRLEEILATDDQRAAREEAQAALVQVERLTEVVDRLLARAGTEGRSGTAVPVDVDAVVAQQMEEWAGPYRRAGRRLTREGARGLWALATPGGLAQVLATLLENGLAHGAGTVTVRVRTTGVSVVIEVTDEGAGVPPALGPRVFERSVSGRHSTGLGLAVARDLAEADGGRLELVQASPPVFAVFLGTAPAPAYGGRSAAAGQRTSSTQSEARSATPTSGASSATTGGNTQRR